MTNDPSENKSPRLEINLMEYWSIIVKRKWAVLAFAVPLFVLTVLLSFVIRPTYTAGGTLLIEREPNILSFEEILQIESFNDDYFQTQYKLLQSRTLAGNVIESRKLFENEAFTGKLKGNGAELYRDNPGFRSRLITGFLERLKIEPVPATRLVEVRFEDRDPEFAASMINALFDTFIDMNIQMKYEATAQATEFLTVQIASLKNEIGKDEQALQQYGADRNIIALSDEETTIIEKLGELNRALTEAQVDRLNKQTYYNSIKDVTPEFIPEALANPLIQRLREDYNKLNREYLKMQDRFKEDYPEMQRLRTELESARTSLEAETQNLQKGAYSDWQAALSRERSLNAAFNVQKQEAIELNSNAISYNQLKIELENKKSLLENLMRRQSETGVSARLKGLRTSNVRIVDRAEPPLHPSSPKRKRNIVLALILGLVGGAGLALLFERIDDSIKTFEDVEKASGLPMLGVVPELRADGSETGSPYGYGRDKNVGEDAGGKRPDNGPGLRRLARRLFGRKGAAGEAETNPDARPEGPGFLKAVENGAESVNRGAEAAGGDAPASIDLITSLSPGSNISESFRTLRTSLLLSSAEPRPKCIAVSSPLPREGKTSTLSNLAVTLAQAGKKVLIVDADLRKPRQHAIFGIKNINGLTNYLTEKKENWGLIKPTKIPGLLIINSGPIPPNPLELIGSDKMTALIGTLRDSFDYVLFDTPPILAVTDALELGAKLDGVILVVRAERTTRDALKRVREKLDMVKVKTLGVVLNSIIIRRHDYYHRHGYYGQSGADS